jgi:hypothetical protein
VPGADQEQLLTKRTLACDYEQMEEYDQRRARRRIPRLRTTTTCLGFVLGAWLFGDAGSSTAVALEGVFPAAGECEWPTSVQVFVRPAPGHPAGYSSTEWYQCSGVFVGDLVLTAGHCIAYMDSVNIHFGEDADTPEVIDVPVACNANSDGDWVEMIDNHWAWFGTDIAWCELSSDHAYPIEPVMLPNGCEPQYLRDLLFGADAGFYGEHVSAVASGGENQSATIIGTKRAAPMSVMFERYVPALGVTAAWYLLEGQEDGNDPDVDPETIFGGDSGGPIYFEMANGSWRTLGVILSVLGAAFDLGDGRGAELRAYGLTNSTPRHVRWIELDSDVDITPCHTWSGGKWVWDANSLCGLEYDLSPETGSSWPGCGSDGPSWIGECNGWTPPGPDNKTSPSQAQSMIDVAKFGFGGSLRGELFGIPALTEWVGTSGNDSVTWTNTQSTEVFGGRGHDTLFAGAGADQIHGGTGNDLLYGGSQNDVLVGGRGMDYMQGDAGDDVFVIRGTCEVSAGEVISGGAGSDTLYTPVSLASLTSLGVSVSSIEKIVINNSALQVGTCQSPPATPPLVPAP